MRELAAAIVTAEPSQLSEIHNDIPARLEAVIQRLLQKAPADRFRSASELGEALEQLRDGLRTGELGPQAIRPLARFPRRKAAIAAALLMASALGYWP